VRPCTPPLQLAPSLAFTPPPKEDEAKVTTQGGENAEAGVKKRAKRSGMKGDDAPAKKKAKKAAPKKENQKKGEDEDKENVSP
jgi:hypothetical protein